MDNGNKIVTRTFSTIPKKMKRKVNGFLQILSEAYSIIADREITLSMKEVEDADFAITVSDEEKTTWHFIEKMDFTFYDLAEEASKAFQTFAHPELEA